METNATLRPDEQLDALETSLVEWKHPADVRVLLGWSSLGNFLSGMETPIRPPRRRRPAALGNFLSGMETFLLLLFPITKAFLGNFLSGMETRVVEAPQADRSYSGPHLEDQREC